MTALLADRYRLTEQRLGRGGMGEVFAGRDERLGRPVAIKFMLKDWKEADLARFAQEARVLAALQHPNIVNILDAHVPEKEGDAPFFVMEMLAGRSLADELERTPRIEPQRLLRIAVQVASALSAAHEAGVVHRDLKPSNIMVIDPNGPAETAKVIDFGVARDLDAVALTVTGSIIGTPAYMSPEQALGRRVGPLSDIYSLGALLYHAFVGEPPFRGEAFAAIAVQVAGPEEATMAPALLSGELGAFATLILECLAKDPARRPSSAAIVGERLRLLLTRAAATTAPPPRAPDDVKGRATAPTAWKPAPTPVTNRGKPTSLWWVVFAVMVVAIGSLLATQALNRAVAQSTARSAVTVTWTPTSAPTSPRSGGSTDVAALYRDDGWTCARMRQGEVYCWGDQDRNAVPKLAPLNNIVGLSIAADGILFETSSGKLGWWRPWTTPTFGFWARRGRLGGCSYRECYITGEDGAAYAIRTEFRDELDKATHNCNASNSPCDLPDTWSRIPAPTNGPITHLVVLRSLGAVALIDGSPYLKDAKDDGGWTIVGGVGPLESLESISTISMIPRDPTVAITRKSGTRELLAFDSRTRLPNLSALPSKATDPCEVRGGAVWCGGKQEQAVPSLRSGESLVYAKRGRDTDSVDPRAGHVGWDLCVELVDASQGRIRFACGSSDSTVPF